MLLSLVLACTSTEPTETPAISFLAPTEGATVAAGDVPVSVVVEHFDLEEETSSLSFPLLPLMPAVAFAHNEGEAKGFVRFTLDGTDLDDVWDTQYTLVAVAAGAHTVGAELFFADGDALEPPVSASVTFTAE